MDNLQKEYCERLIAHIKSDIEKYWPLTNEKPNAIVVGENEYNMLEKWYKQSPYYNPKNQFVTSQSVHFIYRLMDINIIKASNNDMSKSYYIAF